MDSGRNITIRTAQMTDAPVLTRLMRRAFEDAYASSTCPEDLNAHMAANFNEENQRKELGNPLAVTLLALAAEQLIGYAQWVETPAPDCVKAEHAVQLQRFYMLKQYWGAGIADHLMKTCLTRLSGTGYTDMWLSCWTENERALKFYRRWGFRARGKEPFRVGSDLQTDYIMVRTISNTGGRF